MTTKNKPPLVPDAVQTSRATPPATASAKAPAVRASNDTEVTDFVAQMKALTQCKGQGRGRLVFAMDATMSRQPTWDMALALQAEMFTVVKDVGGLDVQLVYFRGADECRASKWVSNPDALARLMSGVECHGGYTQIRKVLTHTVKEAGTRKVNALVLVGDAMEENIDDLCGRAGELALIGCPVFLFQEGNDATVSRTFKEIARLTKGAHCRFDAGSAAQLKALLTAVAVYAAGGQKALLALSQSSNGAGARLLLSQIKPGG